jgi:hypothetical protein
MTNGGSIILRRAINVACLFCVFCVFCVPGATRAFAQSRSITPSPSGYNQTTPASQTKGRALLDAIRSSTFDGDFHFDFQIRLRPKRGAATLIPGRLWGSRNIQGPVTRITLRPGSPDGQRDLIIQSGPQSAVWTWSRGDAANTAVAANNTATTSTAAANNNNAATAANNNATIAAAANTTTIPANTTSATAAAANTAARLDPAAMFEPLAGMDLTAFELQMPFIYWDDFTYEGLKAGNFRVTHAFLMRPPPDIAAARPGLASVRIYYDEGYRVITVFEILGPGGVVTKTMRLKDFHLVAGRFMLRKAELRNEATGNGTDFNVLLTGINLDLPRDIFAPEKISTPVEPPPLDQLWKSR